MSAGYEKAIRAAVPDAAVAFDPFHVVQLGGKATDQVRRDEYNQHGRSSTAQNRRARSFNSGASARNRSPINRSSITPPEYYATGPRSFTLFIYDA